MAKRKRLGGPLQDHLTTPDSSGSSSVTSAPIARVAGDASINAAFDEVSRELSCARSEGRLVVQLPLESIEAAWLMRDRADPGTKEDPDFAALLDSLRRNGQRSPIEVVDMGEGRYGLISGWRRLTALLCLHEETGKDRFATVLAFLRQPASSREAYLSMVEENEIRLGLSYYERARIAAKAVDAGAYPSSKAALQSLFASASRAKRSKIGSFLVLYQALGDRVRFPQALTERMGLSLVNVLQADKTAGERLRTRLETSPLDTSTAEQDLFSDFIDMESASAARAVSAPAPVPAAPSPETPERAAPTSQAESHMAEEICPGVYLSQRGGKLHLSGPAVDPAFRARLEAWLRDMPTG